MWTYISALGSVGFGWLLNELSQIIRTRQSDKRIKKKVLFYLLETLHTFKKLDINDDIEAISEALLKKLPKEVQNEEGKKFLQKFYRELISNLIEKEVANNMSELEESYKLAIEDLSLVDPLSAYILKGKNKILDTFDQLAIIFNQAENEFPEEGEEIKLQGSNVMEILKPELLTESIKDLEEEVRNISWSIGIWTWHKCRRAINKPHKIDNEKKRKIEELLDRFMPQISAIQQ